MCTRTHYSFPTAAPGSPWKPALLAPSLDHLRLINLENVRGVCERTLPTTAH